MEDVADDASAGRGKKDGRYKDGAERNVRRSVRLVFFSPSHALSERHL